MNADHINPFIQGSQNILDSIYGEKPGLGNLFLKQYPYKVDEISITVGIVGDISGKVIYNLSEHTACSIASKMMFGMPVEHLDELSQSAVSELANMISGNVATIFSEKGKFVDITPPIFIANPKASDFPFIVQNTKLICMPLNFMNGEKFEVDILLME